jgi:nucleotide-binding universal stress UspA family protein
VLEPSIYRTLEKNVTEMAVRLEEAVEESVERKLRDLLPPEVSDWSRVVAAVPSGATHAEILRYAKDIGADLIVLGIRGHRLLHEVIVGSTTDRVIRQAHCPVLTLQKDSASKLALEAESKGKNLVAGGART